MIHLRTAIPCCLATLAVAGCREPAGAPRPPASQAEATHIEPATPPKPKPATATAQSKTPPSTTTRAGPSSARRVVVTVRDPDQPQRGWLIIEKIAKPPRPASAIGVVAGPRKLVVTTDNVKVIRIDLPKAGMPADRRVILRIDNQGIEITGRYGPEARFERSRQGDWSSKRKKQ